MENASPAPRKPEAEPGERGESRERGPAADPTATTDRTLLAMAAPVTRPDSKPVETRSARERTAAPMPPTTTHPVVESQVAVEVRIGTISLELLQATAAVLPARPEPRRRREQPSAAVGLRRHYVRDW